MENKQSKITKIKKEKRNKNYNVKRVVVELAAELISGCLFFAGGYALGSIDSNKSENKYTVESRNKEDYDFNSSINNKLRADILNNIFNNTSQEEMDNHRDIYNEILCWLDYGIEGYNFRGFITDLAEKDSKDSSDVIKKEDIKFFNNLDGKSALSWDYEETINGNTYKKNSEIPKEAYILEKISTYGDYDLYKINDGKQVGIAKGNNLVIMIDDHFIYENNSIPLKDLSSIILTNNQLLQKDTLSRDELYNKLVFDINDSIALFEDSFRENNLIDKIFVLDTNSVPNFNGDERYAIFVGTDNYYFDERATICIDINNPHNKLVIQPRQDYCYKYYNCGNYEKDKIYFTDGLTSLDWFLCNKGMEAKSIYTLNELKNLAFDINSEENQKEEITELNIYAGFTKELNNLRRNITR